MIKKHETLLDVMSCHQDDVVKKLACLTKVWTHTLTNHCNSLEGHGSEREQCMFDDEHEIAPLMAFNFFLHLTCTNTTACENLENFRGHLTI